MHYRQDRAWYPSQLFVPQIDAWGPGHRENGEPRKRSVARLPPTSIAARDIQFLLCS
jgi:hypothetical protein